MKKTMRIFIAVFGFGVILFGFIGDRFGNGSAGMGPFNFFCIGIGVSILMTGVFFPKAAYILGVNILMFIVLFFIMDFILYAGAPLLPRKMVAKMSEKAQIRFSKVHYNGNRYINVSGPDHCNQEKYGRPLMAGFESTYTWQYDEFGYRNPIGYINDKKPIDIVLVGDSFTEGVSSATTIADFLRDYLNSTRVYSLGMSFSRPDNWKCQYRRFAESPFYKDGVRLVIANFYSGNDFMQKSPADDGENQDISLSNESFSERLHADISLLSTGIAFADDLSQTVVMDTSRIHETRLPFKNELFMILEKSIDEFIYSNILMSEKKTVWHKILHRFGFNLDRWVTNVNNTLGGFREQDPREIDWPTMKLWLVEFKEMVRRFTPQAKIVLSYIPTVTSVCDVTVRNQSPEICEIDIKRQKENSQKLGELCHKVGLAYIDVSPELQAIAANREETIYHVGAHFSKIGYGMYSRLIAERLPFF